MYSTRIVSLLVVLALTSTACETGTEVVGIESTEAHRETDGRIRVDVLLACELVAGMPRADDSCDADGADFCIEARFLADGGGEVGRASGCDSFKHVRGTRMAVLSKAAVPTGAKRARVWSSMRGEGGGLTVDIAAP